ncbi:hypothetical protein COMA1_11786 [Candidatus Nitrospira nitrosa]|uniref:Uncharacterized protein n=1 Tax=Candidatus Nitrospira nitrosa TaxID=1742972 RepID=A0A0S4LD21_9BACT|nr:hypothetical protein COMA1_11786 [Candidatus Nitrospira nitrosa]
MRAFSNMPSGSTASDGVSLQCTLHCFGMWACTSPLSSDRYVLLTRAREDDMGMWTGRFPPGQQCSEGDQP